MGEFALAVNMPPNETTVCDALSAARLAPYLAATQGDQALALENYRRNVLLCESLYPSLHFLEVTLRNRFEVFLTQEFGGQWYSNPAFEQTLAGNPGHMQLQEALSVLQSRGRPLTSGGVVAELNFGFWTGLLGNRYRGRFSGPGRWILFPSQTLAGQGSAAFEKAINSKLWQVRYLRNRVFHHEPIWADPALWTKYQGIRELIVWICPDVAAWTNDSGLDRFPAVFHQS